MSDVGAVEQALAVHYDQEAADRAGRALDPQREAERTTFIDRLDAGTRVLEVGIGPGRDAAAFVDAGLSITGIDLSSEHARHARAVGAEALVATVRQLPFPDRTFDALWTMSTLMHVPNDSIVEAVTELRRVMAPGSLCAIGVWGGPDVEHHSEKDTIVPPRFFSRRSDARWQELLARLGTVEDYQTWREMDGGFRYQWAIVRT